MPVADRLSQLSDSQYRVARVRIGDRVARVRVPRDATPEQAVAIAQRAAPKQKRSLGSQLAETMAQRAAALVRGPGNLIDAPTEALAGAMRYIGAGGAKLGAGLFDAVGLDSAADAVRDNARTWDRALARPATVRSITESIVPPPTSTAGKIADFGAEMLGAAAVPFGPKPPKPRPQFPGPRTPKEVPSVPQLKQQADELYDIAEAKGVTASKTETGALAESFKKIAEREGLVSPTGRVSSAYPKTKEALDLAADYAEGTMKPSQMKTFRKVLSEAAGNPDPSERRIATIMLREFDDWTAPLAPEFAQARQVARRYISAGKIDDAIEAANVRASQFSGSGLENALRTEFRGLDRKIVNGKERGFIPEVEQAIQNVSRGTKASNFARNVGKLAPTGVVSAGLSTGVPFAVGTTMGGPALGGAFSAATTGAGLLGRRAATKMAERNAEIASLIARNGGGLSAAPSIGADSIVAPYLQRGLFSASPRAASVLDESLLLPLAADDDREDKKKKKKR